MKKILFIFCFIQSVFSVQAQNLDSTMSYCFGKTELISSFEKWSRPRIFDFDNDGDKDFVVIECFNDSLEVYINNGSADFTVTPTIKISIPNSQADLCAADFDGDSYIDIAIISDAGDISVYKNQLGISYALASFLPNTTFPNLLPHKIEAHDLNNDGLPDIIGSGEDTAAKNFYAFTFEQTTTPFVFGLIKPFPIFPGHNEQSSSPQTHFSFGDINADGYYDLVIGSDDLSDTLEVYKNAGSVSITFVAGAITYTNPASGFTKYVIARDFNSDGLPDIAVSSSNGFSIGKNLATGFQFSPMLINTSVLGEQFDILDLNSDNNKDLVIVDQNGNYFIYTGTSSVSVSFGNIYNTFFIWEADKIGFADFDGNSIPDLLAVGRDDFPYLQVSRNFSFHIENIIVSTNTVICGSSPVNFSVTNTSSYPGVYSWTPGPASGTLYTATSAGGVSCAFSYTLPPGLGQCTLYTDTIFVNSMPAPTATLSASPGNTVCLGTSVILTASVSGSATYTWSTGSSANSITIIPSSNSVYSLSLDNGCPGTETVGIMVNPKPAIAISAPLTTICSGDSVMLTVNGASTYSWSPSGSTLNNITVKPATTSNYNVIGVNSFGCSDTAGILITVNFPPSLNITSSKPFICLPDTVTLSASGATSYTWSTGSTLSVITVTPLTSGNFTLTGSNGCVATKSISLPLYLRPNVTATSSKPLVCSGDSVTLKAFGATSYTWALPYQLGNSVYYYPTANTTYSVLGLGANGCYNYTTIAVSVNTGSNVSIVSSSPELCIGKPVTISAIGATTYTWNNNTNNPSFNITPPNNQPLSYTVAATDINGCKSIASQVFAISDKCHLIIYNGITPNGDGHNDFFFIGNIEQYPGCVVTIYNRWGQKLSEIRDYNNTNNFWSGSDGNTNVPSGTYFYVIDLNNNSDLLKGFIELTKKDFN